MKKIIVINGPNLNLLGTRETATYGKKTLKDVEDRLRMTASQHDCETEFFQSNHEGEIVDFLHTVLKSIQEENDPSTVGIIINAGAFTHTSVAIRDALSAMSPMIPFIEVHVSNIFRREPFRHHSYLSDISAGVIVGMGVRSYELALSYFLEG